MMQQSDTQSMMSPNISLLSWPSDVIRLFGLHFRNVTLAETVDLCEALLRAGERGLVFTPNTDHIVRLSCDPAFREAYRNATLGPGDEDPANRHYLVPGRTTGTHVGLLLAYVRSPADLSHRC